MSDVDGFEDALRVSGDRLAGYMRVALTVAARLAEQQLHRRQQMLRTAGTWGIEHQRRVEMQLRGEASAAKGELRQLVHPEWWEKASPEQMAHAWATARAYGEIDPELAGLARWIGSEIERRHGQDPEALFRQVEAEARAERAEQVAVAALMVEADVADRDAYGPRAEVDGFAPVENREAEVNRVMTEQYGQQWADRDDLPAGEEARVRGEVAARWDSPERRERLADRLDTAQVPAEAKEARLLADQSAGSAPSAAVTPIDPARRAQRPRQQARGRGQGLDR